MPAPPFVPAAPRLGRRVSLVFALHVAGLGLAYGMQLVLARLLGEAGYGAFAYALGWSTLAAVALSGGLPEAALRFAAGDDAASSAPRAAFVRFGGRALAAVAVGALLAALGAALLPRADAGVPSILAPALLVVALLVPTRWQNHLLRARGRAAAATALDACLRPLLVICGLLVAWSLHGAETGPGAAPLTADDALLVLALGIGAIALAQHALLRRAARLEPAAAQAGASPGQRARWLAVSGPLLGAALVGTVAGVFDVLLLGTLAPLEEVGVYRAASRTAVLVLAAGTAVNAVAAPMIAPAHADGPAALSALVLRATRWTFWPSVAIAVVLAAASGLILDLFGTGFGRARPVVFVLLAGYLVNAATGPVGYMLNLTGHQRASLGAAAAATGVGVLAAALLIPSWGAMGAAVAVAITQALRNGLHYWLGVRHLGVRAGWWVASS